MAYDLPIKNGVVIDGPGLPRAHGNTAIKAGRFGAIPRGIEYTIVNGVVLVNDGQRAGTAGS